MTQPFVDLLGLIGFLVLMAGIWLAYGLALTLIVGGLILILLSLAISCRNEKRRHA